MASPPLTAQHFINESISMSDRHFDFWPEALPHHLSVPATNLYYNVEVAAARFPDKPFILFYDTPVSFARFKDETQRIAGYLEQVCGIKKGDRVLLFMQNSPQFMLAYYAILRANAVVVPVNPMNLTNELRHLLTDTGATTAFVAQDLLAQVQPLLDQAPGQGLDHVIAVAYCDYLGQETTTTVPAFVAAPRQQFTGPGIALWHEVLDRQLIPGPLTAGPDDLCVMPYTSGTTGQPKGCMHSHRTVMYNAIAAGEWFGSPQDTVLLSVLPLFHVTGMQSGMNGPLFTGCTVVVLPRWDSDAAALAVERYRISTLALISTMVVDLLFNPRIAQYDLTSVKTIRGGGAAMPAAVAQKLQDLLGVAYVEGYGMSETIAPTHLNPQARPKQQCLGIPIFDVDARVVDPQTLRAVEQGETGEILVHGPQVMLGYWNNPAATKEVFAEIDGKRFLRTGDLARVDADGYFFMVDRLKRMINVAGFKVWPTEVEGYMYQHPAIQEVCIFASFDERRGESVKAAIVLRAGMQESISAQDIIDWAHQNMAAYKIPRTIEFLDQLPKSGTGKIQWRSLQERELPAPGKEAKAPSKG